MENIDITYAKRIADGDEQAFVEIYNKYHGILYSLSLAMLKDKSSAIDAVQWVFTRLWEHREVIAINTSIRNYLYTMTKHYLLNITKSQNTKIKAHYRYAQQAPECEPSPVHMLESKEIAEYLERALMILPARKRDIVQLKRQGLSNEEIATELNISINTVKSQYRESIKLLKSLLRDLTIIVIFIVL